MSDGNNFLPAYVPAEKIPHIYRWLAPVYDIAGVLIGSQARRLALARANIHNGDDVLELGVGTGLTFAEIVRQNPYGRNEGLDISEKMLVQARRRLARIGHSNYRLLHGDARRPPYSPNSFDRIVSTFMLDLFSKEDMSAMLQRWTDLLRPGGSLVLVYQSVSDCWYEQVWDTCYRVFPYVLGGCRGIEPVPLLEEVGLSIHSRESVTRLGVPQAVVVAKR